ncbi:MAG: Rid family hydrolase [Alphaproteobacteria bacterium]|nr:Rid family hydrolase [Alphaproteobacteria bacterium]
MHTDTTTSHRSFSGANGDVEHFLSITAPGALVFEEQLAFVHARYSEALKELGLNPDSVIFKRIFLSDPINQAEKLYASPLYKESKQNPVAVSVVRQPPMPYAKVALIAYLIESAAPVVKKRVSPHHLLIEKNGLRYLWSTRLCSGARAATSSEELQTREVFGDLTGMLKHYGSTLKDHCVRTWLYIKDVDVFYRGMVKSRRDLFTDEGLTEKTHWIASTGIEGACDHQFDLVLMDAYSILNLDPAQMTYLNDFDYLSPTFDYQVTFERGTRIAYADRAHHFISGTASIDNRGNTLHLGDVMRQLERALVNIDVLLKSGGATIDDMMYMIVYLRDAADYERVFAYLRERFPDMPMVIVEAPVCRPEWLIEIEGIAAAKHDAPNLPAF